MLEQLKAKWNESPWYVRIGIPFVALLLIVLKFKDVIGSIVENSIRSKVDQKASTLAASEQAHKDSAIRLEGSIDTLEKEKEDAKNKANTDDATNFHNNR